MDRHHPTVFGSYLRCLLIDFDAVDCSATGRWPFFDFQDGGPKPEVVFSCTILCRGHVFSTDLDCLRRVQNGSTAFVPLTSLLEISGLVQIRILVMEQQLAYSLWQ